MDKQGLKHVQRGGGESRKIGRNSWEIGGKKKKVLGVAAKKYNKGTKNTKPP